MNTLRMTRPVFDQIRAHGEETYPEECCGVLLGRLSDDEWIVETSVATANASPGPALSRYEIAPLEIIRIERDARRSGLEIAGFYHSHPDHPAHWSQTDLAEAHWLGCWYVITAVRLGEATETNAFLLVGDGEETKAFKARPITVKD